MDLIYGGGNSIFGVNYPLLAWVDVFVLGLLFGKLLEQYQSQTYRRAGLLGAIFLVGFTGIRLGNRFGLSDRCR